MGERFFIRHNTLEVYNTSPLFIFILASHTRATSGAFTILTQQLYTQDTGSFGADSDSRLHRHHSTPLHPPLSFLRARLPPCQCMHSRLSLTCDGGGVCGGDRPGGHVEPQVPNARPSGDRQGGGGKLPPTVPCPGPSPAPHQVRCHLHYPRSLHSFLSFFVVTRMLCRGMKPVCDCKFVLRRVGSVASSERFSSCMKTEVLLGLCYYCVLVYHMEAR